MRQIEAIYSGHDTAEHSSGVSAYIQCMHDEKTTSMHVCLNAGLRSFSLNPKIEQFIMETIHPEQNSRIYAHL